MSTMRISTLVLGKELVERWMIPISKYANKLDITKQNSTYRDPNSP
jgi:hypothetical protein